MSAPEHTNRLADETSPYLLQHAHNPVDWYPWGEEALKRAREENRPILLSIGYAACHWCHVMERESFENPDIAALMNEEFVCIKVDREERPDLDDIYMTAVQMMTGHGGWPLTVFLTPEGKPFFGGTYFPPEDRPRMPGFRRVLESIARSFEEEREALEDASAHIALQLAGASPASAAQSMELLSSDLIRSAIVHFRQRFEPTFGGFSQAPKFPHPMAISLLLRYVGHHGDAEVLHMATLSLDRMAYGGMYDQLGGGFHRYSTDERWLVPHFEKMLYDNALLAMAYLEAVQLTGHEEYLRVATETLDWVANEMQGAEGGYFSTLDADSEGEEGRFYVWRRDEIDALLGDDADAFCKVYDISDGGNWEGNNILNLAKPATEFFEELGVEPEALEDLLRRGRSVLLEARRQRVHPGLDDKVLADWNGLMIAAMARGYRVLGERRFLESGRRAADFVLGNMLTDGRLLHSHRCGRSHLLAYVDDYANLIWGLLELYEASFELDWLRHARRLADPLLELFWDEDQGGFFFTGSDHEQLIARLKPGHDGATPSGNAVAANVLLRLQTLTGNDVYGHRATELLRAFQGGMSAAPSGFAQMLMALDYYLSEPCEIAIVGPRTSAGVVTALDRLWKQFRPNDLIVAFDGSGAEQTRAAGEVPLLAGKAMIDGKATFYRCRNYACQAPTHDLEEIVGT